MLTKSPETRSARVWRIAWQVLFVLVVVVVALWLASIFIVAAAVRAGKFRSDVPPISSPMPQTLMVQLMPGSPTRSAGETVRLFAIAAGRTIIGTVGGRRRYA